MKQDELEIRARILSPYMGQPKMLTFTREQLQSNIITAYEAERKELRDTFKFLLEMFDEN